MVSQTQILLCILAVVICVQCALFITARQSCHRPAVKRIRRRMFHPEYQSESPSKSSQVKVSWAIPVGGRTVRGKLLRRLLEALISQAVDPGDIYVFEDDSSRPASVSGTETEDIAFEFSVNHLRSGIDRSKPEGRENFGLYLAQHYHYMLDHLLFPSQNSSALYEYTVIVEDDLVLGSDAVKFFTEMSKVMAVDPTVYCVSGHSDNAFRATSKPASQPVLQPSHFHFRRGNHFMAPGWMISSRMYNTVVRPTWLGSDGHLLYKRRFQMDTGNWDSYMDARIGPYECLFPEVPRISHRGATGYTVRPDRQKDVFDNLRLSTLDPRKVDYGDVVARLALPGYERRIKQFIRTSPIMYCPNAILRHRNSTLVAIIRAQGPADPAWSKAFTQTFGVFGVGGHRPAKQRGIHKGSAFVRWMGNLVLVVGTYSPYYATVLESMKHNNNDNHRSQAGSAAVLADGGTLHHAGCFLDQRAARDLPVLAAPGGHDPHTCVRMCECMGHPVAGLQYGGECWCGDNFHRKYDALAEDRCSACSSDPQLKCGGGSANSVYWFKRNAPKTGATAAAVASAAAVAATIEAGGSGSDVAESTAPWAPPDYSVPPPDVVYVVAVPSQSCSVACEAASSHGTGSGMRLIRPTTGPFASSAIVRGSLTCDETLFPLLHRNCAVLSRLLGCEDCEQRDSKGPYWKMVAPGGTDTTCLLSVGRHLSCGAVPPPKMDNSAYRRVCVCTAVPKQ